MNRYETCLVEKSTIARTFRRLTAGCVVAVALTAQGGAPSFAADQTVPSTGSALAESHHYYLYYLCTSGWELEDCYDCVHEARCAAKKIEKKGYETKIVCRN